MFVRHSCNDPAECGCEHCHECREHNWRMWNDGIECDWCAQEKAEYFADVEPESRVA